MNLRIVSGTLCRRRITLDKNAQQFRPTQERIRQAVAETLKPWIPGACAADLCAGSGAVGIELISRGVATVDFVENDPVRSRRIQQTCADFGIAGQCKVHLIEVGKYCAAPKAVYDIVFYDPPYGDIACAELVPALYKLVAPGGVLVYERDKSALPRGESLVECGAEVNTRAYGDTAVEFIKKKRELRSENRGGMKE
jgi:16S rRNA (guanine966-N2)-methyltransferase